MRTRRPWVRGTRFSSGVNSGVSIGTNPSGVTIDQYGITTDSTTISQAELDTLNGIAAYPVGSPTASKLITSGVSNWAGSTVSLATKLTTIDQIMCSVISVGAATHALTVITGKPDSVAGYVSAAIRYNVSTSGSSLASIVEAPGCSIAFIAFGS